MFRRPYCAHDVVGAGALDIHEALLGDLPPGLVIVEAVVVRQKRMHAVDGDEILGQRIGRAVVVRHASSECRSSACASTSQRPALRQPVVGRRAVPVAGEADVDRLGGEDRRRPFDRMDLGDQRRDDQPGGLVDALVVPVAVLSAAARRTAGCARAQTACASRSGRATSSR